MLMPARLRFILGSLIIVVRGAQVESAAAPLVPPEVTEIMKQNCFECHGPERSKAGLRLDAAESILRGSRHGPVVTAGDPADSELIRRITLAADDEDVMPSEGRPLLSANEVAVLQNWIAAMKADGEATLSTKDKLPVRVPTVAPPPTTVSSPIPAAGRIEFGHDVFPILQRSCFECHGAETQKAGLRLDTRAFALAERRHGPAILPGKSMESEVVKRITLPAGHADIMPNVGEPLSAGEIATIAKWIDAGAEWPEDFEAPLHWAYVPPRRPESPGVTLEEWCKNPVDRFVLARLGRLKLAPAPEASRNQIARRVFFALIGLPPSPEELDRYLYDSSLDAYERLVDRLLASPRYGERWARHWLDLARHADSNGFQRDGFRDVWLYRDWVIEAMNQDMPYDQFSVEQLAGDLIPGASLAQKVATGFNRGANVNVEAGVDQEENRTNQVMDRVNTTAAVWLGSTLECAQCHDHKYDPFKQKDYYRLFAFFNNTTVETEFIYPDDTARIDFIGPYLEMPIPPARQEKMTALLLELEGVEQEYATRRNEYLKDDGWEETARITKRYRDRPVPVRILDIIDITSAQRDRGQIGALDDFRMSFHGDVQTLLRTRDALRTEIAALKPNRTLVMEELSERRETRLFRRGSFLDPDNEVLAPAVPAFLGRVPEHAPLNRLTLARWLVSGENPLAARAAVNRWWAELFGHGLVTTPEDFGLKGEKPTHPELLDWLAVELVQRGWSMKQIIRLIVTSNTFRQSSVIAPSMRERDAANLLYARGPRFRMDAEMIRDNALAIAGVLSDRVGGFPARPYQPPNTWRAAGRVDNRYQTSVGDERFRRGVYVVVRRSTPYPSFINFDAPARTACVVKRSRSNTPMQALTLLNDPVYVEAARYFVRRVIENVPSASAVTERTRHAFRLCLSREPVPREMSAVLRLYQLTYQRYTAAPQLAQELVGSDASLTGVELADFAAWQSIASALLNLDQTITRE